MSSPTIDRSAPAVHLRIGSDRLTVGSGGVHDHISPSTGLVDGTVPLAGAAEIDTAVEAAHQAFGRWRRAKTGKRRELLLRLADLIDANADEFARRNALDNGTPVTVAGGMVSNAAEWTRYYAGWADKATTEVTSTYAGDREFAYTLSEPYGVIGMIITWNTPLVSLAMKVPAALAAGNTVVIKPSELTPFTAELYADLVAEAGFPPGVVNIAPGDASAGAALVAHPLVKKISFTGGPETARRILAGCAEQIKPSIMELGGKSANILFADADLDTACAHGSFMSVGIMSGQGCAFPMRMLAHRSIYDDVIARMTASVESIPVGDPFDPSSISGPVVNEAALERILGMIDRAVADGARLVTGGRRVGGDLAGGFYLEPTILADVDPASEMGQKEVFGPVLSIIPFSSDDEALDIANGTEYGLAAYISTSDIKRAHRVVERLVAGTVAVNGSSIVVPSRPFGGFGLSGMGKEGGRAGLDDFLRIKGVSIA